MRVQRTDCYLPKVTKKSRLYASARVVLYTLKVEQKKNCRSKQTRRIPISLFVRIKLIIRLQITTFDIDRVVNTKIKIVRFK